MVTDNSSAPAPVLKLGKPADVVAVVPYLLAGPLHNCLVLLGLRAESGRVRFASRCALPAPADRTPESSARIAAGLISALRADSCTQAIVVGYGPPRRVDPVIDAVRAEAVAAGATVSEALRVHGGRYWSSLCPFPHCCPDDGTPVDPGASHIPAAAVRAGLARGGAGHPILHLAPVVGTARTRMQAATVRAEARCARMWGGRIGAGGRFGTEFRAEGVRAVREFVAAARATGPPTAPDRIAWLGVLLVAPRVRDEAWVHISPEHAGLHVDLWSHVLRHVERAYAAAPASLLAFAAWQCGDRALAAAALDRAEQSDRGYSMAALIRRALDTGVRPDTWDHFGPEWLEEVSPVRGPAGPRGPDRGAPGGGGAPGRGQGGSSVSGAPPSKP